MLYYYFFSVRTNLPGERLALENLTLFYKTTKRTPFRFAKRHYGLFGGGILDKELYKRLKLALILFDSMDAIRTSLGNAYKEEWEDDNADVNGWL